MTLLEKTSNLLDKIATEIKDDYFIDTDGLIISSEEIFDISISIQKLYDLAEVE